jgi:hypothetical protein
MQICDLRLELYINYQLDVLITIYSQNFMSLYMFRALNAHLQDDTLYTCSIWYCHSRTEYSVYASYFLSKIRKNSEFGNTPGSKSFG